MCHQLQSWCSQTVNESALHMQQDGIAPTLDSLHTIKLAHST